MADGATVIGRVAVAVIPDTEDFRKDAKRQLSAIEKSLKPVNIDFKADTKKAVSEVRDALRDAQKAAKEIGIDFDVNGPQKRRVQAEMAKLTRPRTAEIFPKVNKAAAAKAGATLAALSGGRAFNNLSTDFAEWVGELDKSVPRMALATTAITNLVSAVGAGTSNVFAFAGSLATVVGSGLALPGLFAGMAFGGGAAFAVLKDFNDVLPEVGDKFHDLQDRMSSRFWKVAEAPFRSFINTIFPQFSAGLERTSGALGVFFKRLADSARVQFDGQLDGMFDDLNQSIRIASRYTDDFIGIISKLGTVGAGNLPRLAKWFGDSSNTFDNWLANKGKSGLQRYVDTGVEALQDLGGVIRYTGSTLAGLAKAAEAAGGGTLDSLRRTMKGVSREVNSASFQRDLTGVFEAMHIAMDEITNRSGPQFRGFASRLASTLTTILPTAGKTAGKALGAIFDALDQPQVEASLVGAFDKLDVAIDNIVPTLPKVARALAGIVDVVGDVVVNVSRALGPALDGLAPVLDGLAADLRPLVEGLGNSLVNAVETAVPVVADLGGALGELAGFIADVLTPINALVDLFQKLPEPITGAISKLTSVGLIVGGAAWIGAAVRAKLMLFSAAILNAGTRAGVAQGAFLRAGIAAEGVANRMSLAKTAAAGAGLAIATLGAKAAGSNEALATLATTAGGALLGFSVAGPIGAAIGAGAGALYGLESANNAARQSFRDSIQMQEDYRESLDQTTAAITRQTRQTIYSNLEKGNAFDISRLIGISDRDMVGAVAGSEAAIERVTKRVNELTGSMKQLKGPKADMFFFNKQRANDFLATLRNSGKALTDEQRALLKSIRASQTWAEALKGIPKNVRTRLEQLNYRPTMAQIRRLKQQYDLTPRQVRTIIREAGGDETVRSAMDAKRALEDVGKQKPSPKIDARTDEASGRVSRLHGDLRSLGDEVAKATVAIVDNATAKINSVRNNLTSLRNKDVTITTHLRTIRHGGSGGGGGAGGFGPVDALPRVADISGPADALGRRAAAMFKKGFSRELERLTDSANNVLGNLLDKVGPKRAKATKARFADEFKLLGKLTKQHDKLMRQYDRAVEKLGALKAELAAFKDEVFATISDSANPFTAGVSAYGDIVGVLEDAAAQADAFQKVIEGLTKKGLNETTLKQILAAGPEAGLAVAQSILAGGVKQINTLQQQINEAATSTGKAAGSYLFGDLIGEAQGDVDKLIKKLGPLQQRLRKFAKDLVSSLRDELNKQFKKGTKDAKANAARIAPAAVTGGRPVAGARAATKADSSTGTTNILIYNAPASSASLSKEEQLFAAGARGRQVFAA